MPAPHRRALAASLFAACLLAACHGPGRSETRQADAPAASPVAVPPTAPRAKIVVLGDSLTAGLGLAPGESFPAQLQRRVDAAALPYDIVNAGVSGDTSAGGLRRLDWSLQPDTRVLVLALGANDGLRGLPVAEMQRNLAQIIERARAKGILVIVAGMEAPPNFGGEYASAFRQSYRSLAERYHVRLVPFLLAGVAGDAALNQADGIHPNPAGAAIVADTVWSALQPELVRLSRS